MSAPSPAAPLPWFEFFPDVQAAVGWAALFGALYVLTRSWRGSLWFWLLSYLLGTWVYTVWQMPSPWLPFLLLAGAVAALFYLEGAEIAFTALLDKDRNQVASAPIMARLADKKDFFYEAREWVVIFCIAGLTLVVEKDEYLLPGLGVLRGHTARAVMTILLTTVPLIWLAQGPGKALGRDYALNFLQLGPAWSVVWLFSNRGAMWLFEKLGLEQPSEKVAAVVKQLHGLRDERNLEPGEEKFFTDAARKYGVAVLFAKDRISIAADGACTFDHDVLYYIADRQQEINRRIKFSAGKNGNITAAWKVFAHTCLPERVDKPLLDHLRQVFEKSRDGEPLDAEGKAMKDLAVGKNIALDASSEVESKEKEEDGLEYFLRTVKVRFPTLPNLDDHKAISAVLVYVRFQGKTQPGAFLMPAATEAAKQDHYFKLFKVPCYRAEVELKLDPQFVFTELNSQQTFSAKYDESFHYTETERLRQLQEPEERDKEGLKQPKGGICAEDSSAFRFYLHNALPGFKYQGSWLFRRRS